ncbi:hypothetical protein [Conexibacter arvalis]|uniref:Uncharacterized protein n=1 Tax=Conexibacter arvalis TaxID=912552 RepID=A0A840IMI0_9ACTN|nr:hypothetical protein [Conexibacter arvalis]MBB4665204.1 hypothetical protein [Conexibacter arvalis]
MSGRAWAIGIVAAVGTAGALATAFAVGGDRSGQRAAPGPVVETVAPAYRLAASSVAPPAPAAAARVAVRRLTCDNSLGAARPRGGRADVVAPPVLLMSLDRFRRHPHRHFRPTDGRPFAAKSPLVVDAGATARIAVPRADRGHVWLDYGVRRVPAQAGDRPHTLVIARTCAGRRPTGWPGAVVVDGARCVRLTIRSGASPAAPATTVRVPFGRGTCRGR